MGDDYAVQGGNDDGRSGSGGSGGGGNGSYTGIGQDGTANLGGGGGGSTGGNQGGAGGSGVVIIKYSNTYTPTIGAGLTSSTATSGAYKITTFTAGTGTVSFA